MRFLILLVPLILAFNYRASLQDWEINNENINALKISIRGQLASLKSQCDFEKDKKKFPLSCYGLLKSMRQLNPGFDYKSIESNLNKRCETLAVKIVSMNQVKLISSRLPTKSICRDILNKRKEIIKYKLEI